MMRISVSGAAAILLFSVPAVCQTQEHAPVSLKSASKLAQDQASGESWTYIDPDFQKARFNGVCVLPTKIYSGPDAQFPGTSVADKQRFADILTTTLVGELSQGIEVSQTRKPGCLSIQMTIVGVSNTKTGFATASRILPIGLATNAFKSATGKKGSFSGSMLLATEMTGGKNNKLFVSAVRRKAPDALDIPSTLSMTDTVKAISRDVGKSLRERLVASGVLSDQ